MSFSGITTVREWNHHNIGKWILNLPQAVKKHENKPKYSKRVTSKVKIVNKKQNEHFN